MVVGAPWSGKQHTFDDCCEPDNEPNQIAADFSRAHKHTRERECAHYVQINRPLNPIKCSGSRAIESNLIENFMFMDDGSITKVASHGRSFNCARKLPTKEPETETKGLSIYMQRRLIN